MLNWWELPEIPAADEYGVYDVQGDIIGTDEKYSAAAYGAFPPVQLIAAVALVPAFTGLGNMPSVAVNVLEDAPETLTYIGPAWLLCDAESVMISQ